MSAIAKRVFLFVVVNILVVLTLSITMMVLSRFFGISLEGYSGLLILYSVIGMGGAFISLFMSKWIAKKMFRIQIIDPRTSDPEQRSLVEMVHGLARQAGLKVMPEVGFYDSPEVNAFATGPSRKNSLVAVSAGLLHRMDKEQVEGVLGHEVAHIANGDMVTMTLIQGIINTLVLFISRLAAIAVANAISGDRDRGGSWGLQFGLYIAFQMILGILGAVVVNYFSRRREFRADAGSARIAGREKMISALRALGGTEDRLDNEHKAFASLKISGRTGSALARLLSTHPPLEERIQRLQSGRI